MSDPRENIIVTAAKCTQCGKTENVKKMTMPDINTLLCEHCSTFRTDTAHTPGPLIVERYAIVSAYMNNQTEENWQKLADYINADLLSSLLVLIDLVEEYEQEHGISTLGAAQLHEAKVATLNAQGRTEEGYNA
jgi:hypothetical protein